MSGSLEEHAARPCRYRQACSMPPACDATAYHWRLHSLTVHRIDSSTRAQDLFGPGKDGFTGGDPLTGKPPTDLSAEWCNDLQENIVAPIEYAGLTLEKGNGGQLLQAIRGLVNRSLVSVLTQRTADAGYGGSFLGVTYGGGLFVAVGDFGEIQTSPDGVTWRRSAPSAGVTLQALISSPETNHAVIVGDAGSIYTTPALL